MRTTIDVGEKCLALKTKFFRALNKSLIYLKKDLLQTHENNEGNNLLLQALKRNLQCPFLTSSLSRSIYFTILGIHLYLTQKIISLSQFQNQ